MVMRPLLLMMVLIIKVATHHPLVISVGKLICGPIPEHYVR